MMPQAEQDQVARLRGDVAGMKLEAERVATERAAERNEFSASKSHQEEIARANVARLESQMASLSSQGARVRWRVWRGE